MADRNDASITEVVQAGLDARFLDLHTCMPGIVVSYDDTEATADIKPAVKRVLDRDVEELPTIKAVPVAWPGAGGAVLKMALAAGDMVWLMFSEASWARYRENGKVSEPDDQTRHGLSYPVAYPMARVSPPAAVGPGWYTTVPVYVGAPGAAEFLALKADLEELRDAILAWTPLANDGGLALKNALQTLFGTGPAWSWPVGTSKLKGE